MSGISAVREQLEVRVNLAMGKPATPRFFSFSVKNNGPQNCTDAHRFRLRTRWTDSCHHRTAVLRASALICGQEILSRLLDRAVLS